MKLIPQVLKQTPRLALAGAALLSLMAVPPNVTAGRAQTPPAAVDGASHRIGYAFYAAASREDLAAFLENRHLMNDGLRDLWPTSDGKPAVSTAKFHGIRRADFDSERAKRAAQADALLASGRVRAQEAQRVRLVQTGVSDFGAWENVWRAGVANYAARGTRHETMRLVELLSGPQKGQHVWTTARLSNAAEPERVGWYAVRGGISGGGSPDTAGVSMTPMPTLKAEITGTGELYDPDTGFHVYSGIVRNTTGKRIRDIEIDVQFFNQGRLPVGNSHTVSTGEFEPGDVWRFSVPWPALSLGAVGAVPVSVKATPVFASGTTDTVPKSKYK